MHTNSKGQASPFKLGGVRIWNVVVKTAQLNVQWMNVSIIAVLSNTAH